MGAYLKGANCNGVTLCDIHISEYQIPEKDYPSGRLPLMGVCRPLHFIIFHRWRRYHPLHNRQLCFSSFIRLLCRYLIPLVDTPSRLFCFEYFSFFELEDFSCTRVCYDLTFLFPPQRIYQCHTSTGFLYSLIAVADRS